MRINKDSTIQIGDWVRAKSSKGILMHGFVEKTEFNHNVVQIHVVACDNKMLTGQSIQINPSKVNRLTSDFAKTENQLYILINMALETRDEDWFHELVSQWNKIKKRKEQNIYHVDYERNNYSTDYRL
ncbi:IDEAL domain-containing protein [Paraliobacillus sp. JSM ZJ581]|uniref:IDEAL domain-containing protein n=1 Tax=Paraliobacillus sp. JSM ZJ581 TaxID=3342118 RepID=UPI0035A8DC84